MAPPSLCPPISHNQDLCKIGNKNTIWIWKIKINSAQLRINSEFLKTWLVLSPWFPGWWCDVTRQYSLMYLPACSKINIVLSITAKQNNRGCVKIALELKPPFNFKNTRSFFALLCCYYHSIQWNLRQRFTTTTFGNVFRSLISCRWWRGHGKHC